ncbi:MAG: DNA repair protein RecN, partial [Acidobacteriaceae bacterium]|nr:DNA repair protein RecN [Acidobacteriaceae bacterium]
QRGLNILTGETGSGKSIVVDSLNLLLGARASADMIRSGESKARVSGIFAVGDVPEVQSLFDEAGIETETNEEVIVEREISANGKSRAFVANRPVTTAFLRQLAPALADIHGQNEQQLLFTGATQLALLDEFANVAQLRTHVAAAHCDWRNLSGKLAELARNEQEKLRLLDLWTFQRNEIDAVSPRLGEDAELEAERKVLQNVTRLQENASGAFDALYESPESATKQLRSAMKRLDELIRIDPASAGAAASLKEAIALVDDAAFSLRDYLGHLEADPNRLEEVESRLAAIDRLRRKYGGSVEEVLAFRDDVARRADEIENAAEHRAVLEKQLAEASQCYEKLARELSEKRTTAAARLGRQVEAELKGLAMSGTRLEIDVKRSVWSASGMDDVDFLVSPNRGEELKPLEKIASGGELSRIALALKTAIGGGDQRSTQHTLVFDEVDAGVGGAAAAAVGKRLKKLSRGNQVICVTHLAQIAGFADHHYAVAKREKGGRVITEVEELGREQRAREIGRMLSGEHVTPEALKQAEQLMEAGKAS